MSNIDLCRLITAEAKAHAAAQAAYNAALMARRAAYALESDPLKAEAEYDALRAGDGRAPDYSRWLDAVEAIKQRIPLPPLPDPEAPPSAGSVVSGGE